MRILKGRAFNPGDKKPIEVEERMEDVKFNVFKFNNRPKPTDKKRIIVITNFSEFGCESVALMYCIPIILKTYPGAYFIAVGWYGREYLYRHLVDEFWEIKEEHQWLREYSRAFSHESKNLARIEKNLGAFGQVLQGAYFGHICLGNTCKACRHFWGDSGYVEQCVSCGSKDVLRSLFGDIPHYKPQAVHIPKPKGKIVEEAREYLQYSDCWAMDMRTDVREAKESLAASKQLLADFALATGTKVVESPSPIVGIFARNRQCYGRNLPSEFYSKLISKLDDWGYRVVWLGEKQSTMPVPEDHADHVLDFSRMPESRNLELTLAIISQCEFTIQFWTASTRLAAMVGVPWILFESPDQIVGQGQEGMRIALTTDKNKKKLILAHYLNVLNNHDEAIKLLERCIKEMRSNNWSDIIGMVEKPDLVNAMLAKKQQWE